MPIGSFVSFQYSGTDTHFTASYDVHDRFTLSFVLWGMEFPGLAATIRF